MVRNLIYLSPHFPPNFVNFSLALKRFDISVLGIAADEYGQLPESLRGALREYYRVGRGDDLGQILEAGRYFKGSYGCIDRVESHNEFFLPYEAALREELGIAGKNRAETERMQRKSLMKEVFRRAGVRVVGGMRATSAEEAYPFTREVGFPVIAKPDRGVGAAATYRLENEDELRCFFQDYAGRDYFLEEYVNGVIHTFDGLTNQDGEIVYSNSLIYSRNIMEVVNEDSHIYYYTPREIPSDLAAAGRAIVAAFDVREKFFHLEFFRHTGGELIALEANIRPPGGMTVDMWNYGDDIDLYQEWARIIAQNKFEAKFSHKNFVAHISRKDHLNYQVPHDELMRQFGHMVVHVYCVPHLFRGALGHIGYIARDPDFGKLKDFIDAAHAMW